MPSRRIRYLRARLAEREIRLDISDTPLDLLGEAGFDPVYGLRSTVYGARPLKRAIRAQLENPLAQEILAGHFVPRDAIEVNVRDGQLGFGALVEEEPVG